MALGKASRIRDDKVRSRSCACNLGSSRLVSCIWGTALSWLRSRPNFRSLHCSSPATSAPFCIGQACAPPPGIPSRRHGHNRKLCPVFPCLWQCIELHTGNLGRDTTSGLDILPPRSGSRRICNGGDARHEPCSPRNSSAHGPNIQVRGSAPSGSAVPFRWLHGSNRSSMHGNICVHTQLHRAPSRPTCQSRSRRCWSGSPPPRIPPSRLLFAYFHGLRTTDRSPRSHPSCSASAVRVPRPRPPKARCTPSRRLRVASFAAPLHPARGTFVRHVLRCTDCSIRSRRSRIRRRRSPCPRPSGRPSHRSTRLW
mmetsp:Transcript_6390/g.39857  ORF Transcript_6390/g.39857 Transcript_6390/m.39857 type:complete len:311 (-) Transcript_6390:17-949(-)